MKKFCTFFVLLGFYLTTVQAAVSVVRTVPLNDAADVAVSTSIVVNFSEDISLGNDSCFLNGVAIEPNVVGKYAIFRNLNLDYKTQYQVRIAEGAFRTSKGENTPAVQVSFITCDRPKPQPKLVDVVVAQDGTGDYTSIRAAVKAAPKNQVKPWLIFIKNGVYEELVRTTEAQTYIHLIGEDPEKTIIKYAINCGSEAPYASSMISESDGQSPVMVANGNNFYATNISFVNSFGYDMQAGPQALAMGSYCDRFALLNCKLYSYQDTWQTGGDTDRHYAKRCYIEGAVDFIYCSGECIFDSCTIGFCRNGTVFVAPSHSTESKYGYVFRNCSIVSSKPGTMRTNNSFGRPWHNQPRTSLINTTLSKDISMSTGAWTQRMGGLPAVFAEYNTMDYMGKPVDLSKRNNYYYTTGSNGEKTGECYAKNILTKEEVDEMTIPNVLRGADDWRPEFITLELDAPQVTYADSSLYWNEDPYAICYMVLYKGSFAGFTKNTVHAFHGNPADYRVRAVSEYGTLGHVSAAPVVSGIDNETSLFKVELHNGMLHASGFEGKAKVECYALSGICTARMAMAQNEVIDLTASNTSIIRVITGNGTKIIKKAF